jgi:hypothetical protein
MAFPYGCILVGSNYYYFTRFFQVNKNVKHQVAFTLVNFWVATVWTKLFFMHPTQEAILRNNHHEYLHLTKIGKRVPDF